ncbi:MAG TPA: hypothetical protein PLK44_00915 [Aestuariivirga sp.]|nr:hypothetical protein [Hyphomicrobiales bacterium]HQY72254.1 hypothetical protein [Aestuariivirga sp.]HRA92562.1 hypothetical protein [Aestuariivirga sp.]
MQSNMLYSSLYDTLEQLVRFDLSREAMLTSLLFSAAGALLLSRFTGAIGQLTLPLNFSALFIGTALANILLDGFDVPAFQYEQEVLLFTLVGLIAGSFAMLWCVRPEHS